MDGEFLAGMSMEDLELLTPEQKMMIQERMALQAQQEALENMKARRDELEEEEQEDPKQ
jgi:TATA-binding protein-associated factor Taf7